MAQTLTPSPTNPLMSDDHASAVRSRISTQAWGLFPYLFLTNSIALVIVAIAGVASRSADQNAPILLWIGLLAIFVPTAARLLSIKAERQERIALIVLLGVSLYLVKVLHSPLDFTFHDEFLHWRTAANILRDGVLFTPNSILPVSPSYPGLEILTGAFAELSGLSIPEAGLITLGIVRVGFMLALYLLYEQVSSSPQIGALAALLYTANSNFIFFDSQFSYESLALPLATTVLYAVATRDERHNLRLFALALPLIIFTSMTHHLTAYVMSGFIGLWAVVAIVQRRSAKNWIPLVVLTALSVSISFGWSSFVGGTTSDYLLPVFRSGIAEILSIFSRTYAGRPLFENAAGGASPIWERYAGVAAVVCILVILPIGMFQVIRSAWLRRPLATRIAVLPTQTMEIFSRYRGSAAAIGFAVIVILHPVMQAFRLTSSGWEIANRSSEFLFWAIAFILAVGVLLIGSLKIPHRLYVIGFTLWASIIFVGGAISGWPPWSRLPGTYLVSADSRSVEPESIAAARWANDFLTPQSRMSADRINTLLMSVYGNQRMITHLADGIYLASVYYAPVFGETEFELMRRANVEYMLLDRRLSMNLPLVGIYFEAGEPDGDRGGEPFPIGAMDKFDSLFGASRIFDSGSIQIYDVEAAYATR